jgi:hypothetical protein
MTFPGFLRYLALSRDFRAPCMENGMKRKQLPDFDGTIPLHRIALSGAWG